jgi:hypothetical protein
MTVLTRRHRTERPPCVQGGHDRRRDERHLSEVLIEQQRRRHADEQVTGWATTANPRSPAADTRRGGQAFCRDIPA